MCLAKIGYLIESAQTKYRGRTDELCGAHQKLELVAFKRQIKMEEILKVYCIYIFFKLAIIIIKIKNCHQYFT